MKTEQFEIETGDRKTRLTGHVDFPDSSAERGAVVLMVPGGWFMDRDGYMGGSGTDRDMIYRDLANGILEAGIAVLRFDNRGVRCNEMTMPPCPDGSDELAATRHYLDVCVDTSIRQTVTVQTQMDDVENVWKFALNHCDLNPARALIWAHSEGGLNVARLIGSKRIDPRGVLFVGTITQSPASVFQWQTVDRYAEHIMSWDEDGDGRVTQADIQRQFVNDELLAAVGMAPEVVAAPKEGWTKETIRQRFIIEYEKIRAAAVAETDDAPYPRPGDGDEVHVVVASNNWWKQWFDDWTPVIDHLAAYRGYAAFHIGEIDSQHPGRQQMSFAENRIRQGIFDRPPHLILHPQRGHSLRRGEPTMGPMDDAAKRSLVAEVEQILSTA